eukprot:TRINITY_DN13156_c0_g1_i1.p1 TRINITY_DN13156_c0_g1~~TRINITY_DN13156_c0_g1_i1.p1  ORF type:complete len:510 (+),score=146.08 TRINITY_DN13156_c0_g1_i1:108-1637(+)
MKSLRSSSSTSAGPGGIDPMGRRRSLSRFFKEMEEETIVTGTTYNEGERLTRRDSFEKNKHRRDGDDGGGYGYFTPSNVKSYAIYSDSEDDEEDTEDLEDKILRRQLALQEHERRMKRRQEGVGGGDDDEEEDEEYYDDGRDYFRFAQEKRPTSNHNFSLALKAPMQELLSMDVRSVKQKKNDNHHHYHHHARHEKQLRMDVRSEFARWRAQLLEGFNLVLHGLGSKKGMLEKFASHHRFGVSCYGEVFVINGYFQTNGSGSSNLISQLLRLLTTSLGLRGRVVSGDGGGTATIDTAGNNALMEKCLLVRRQIAAKAPDLRVFVMINNIEALRNAQDQLMLSLLAEIDNIHLVATVDHINACALWDGETMARFNWLWHEVTTFAPYDYETRHDSFAFGGGSSSSSSSTTNAKAVSYVLSSLTENARKIFGVLAMHQLEDPQSPGLTLSQWFAICEEKLYTTSETSLKHQLRELTDHKIVLTRKGKTGLDYLYINLPPAALSQALSSISK